MDEQTVKRRTPKQARSQQRVDHLLDTAAAVFAEVGYEAATTNAIARRAGMSIGSLYQFFPNKEAIFDALAGRYMDELRSLFGQAIAPDVPITAAVRGLMQGLAVFDATHTGFKAVFTQPTLPVQHLPAAQAIHRETVGLVDRLLASRFPALKAERRQLGAVVSVAMVKGLMPLSAPPDGVPSETLVEQATYALTGYLRVLLVQEGFPLPPDLA